MVVSIAKLKEIDSSANRDHIIKKINYLHSSYRKEMKKVKSTMKTGSGADNIYQPKLWCFKLLHFLNDQDIQRSFRSNLL